MRTARIKLAGETAVYHCISRIVGGQMLLDSLGQEEMFVRDTDRFGAKRKDGARLIRGVPLPGVRVLRHPRVNAVG